MGGVWGGSWTGFVDRPHFEFTGGLTLRDLQQGRVLPADVKMQWESNNYVYKEEEEMRYNTLSEIPMWARATIEKLISQGALKGNDESGGSLNLSLDMIRVFVVHDMMGLYN